jgi:fatty acid desaturase
MKNPVAGLASRVPRELFERSIGRSLRGIAAVWVGIVLCCWLAGVTGTWYGVLAAAILIGTFQYHLNVMGHDGLHFLLCDSRRINDLLCRWLLHGPHGAPLGRMRRNHLIHHTHFGGPADLDRQYYDTARFRDGRRFLRWLAGSLVGGMTLPIVTKLLGLRKSVALPAEPVTAPQAGRVADLVSVFVSQAWIALVTALLTSWWWAYLPLWLVPMLTVMVGLNSIRSCLEHAEPEEDSPSLNSFDSNRVEAFFLSPFNMNVHAEHHLVPAVPWHRLPELRKFLQAQGLYGEVTLYDSYASRCRQIARCL